MNWTLTKDLECLLFFAQRLRELLFDYTLDTFKPPALNSLGLCEEALNIIIDIENEVISKNSIEPIIKELYWKITEDLIFKEVVGERLNQYVVTTFDINDLKKTKLNLELLIRKVPKKKYIETSQIQLKNLILENRQKRKIDKLLTAYISTLIDLGFSQGYLYNTVNNFFFSESNKIESVAQLDDFFDKLKIEHKSFDVIFKCSSIFKEINESTTAFKSKIIENPELKTNDFKEKGFFKKWKGLYFYCENIMALDAQKAKEIVEERMNKLSKLFVFFHHKKQPFWTNEAIIYSTDNPTDYVILKEATSFMKKSNDLPPAKAAKRLNQVIKNFGLEHSSFSKFDRAIDLHGLSIENQYVENQLLQNWIAFETLLVGYSKKTKIDQVLDSLIPFLKYNYIKRILEYLCKQFIHHNSKLFRETMKEISEGDDITEKYAGFMILDKYKQLRHETYSKLDEFPILKYRIFLFNNFFKTSKDVLKYIETHELKIEWQIKRMYRSRNLIVHAGQVPIFTPILVENSHTYLDLLLGSIIELSLDNHQILSIEQAIQEISLRCEYHKKIMKNFGDKKLDENNYLQILLG